MSNLEIILLILIADPLSVSFQYENDLFIFSLRSTGADIESPKDEDEPSYLAEVVFRDLICRASYGNIRSVLVPVLV